DRARLASAEHWPLLSRWPERPDSFRRCPCDRQRGTTAPVPCPSAQERAMKPWLVLAVLFVLGATSASSGQEASPGRIRRLLNDLDSPQFRVREAATRELRQLGEQAVPALEEALRRPASQEVARRLGRLLAPYRPAAFEAHSNGWHWVYSSIAHA